MIDYYEVLPDVTYLLNKHFTPGRVGQAVYPAPVMYKTI